jgi:hypothetical protein
VAQRAGAEGSRCYADLTVSARLVGAVLEGRVSITSAPRAASGKRATLPPCASTTALTMASPRPAPLLGSRRVAACEALEGRTGDGVGEAGPFVCDVDVDAVGHR